MDEQTSENLAVEVQLALAHTPPVLRDPLRIFFELDHRIGRIVGATTEPMLGQMRLAWWREMLEKPVEERPSGDAVLDGVGEFWAGREPALSLLIDAWEFMLAEDELNETDVLKFGEGKASALLAVFDKSELKDAHTAAAAAWIYADFAAKASNPDEVRMLRRIGLDLGEVRGALPANAKGLAVLGALGRRALKRGGRPLMEGRGAALVVTRAAIFGR